MVTGSWLDTLKIDFNKAHELAIISKLSYLRTTDSKIDTHRILEELKEIDQNYYKVTPFNSKSSQAIFVQHKNHNILACTGTDEIRDWLDNARVRKMKQLKGRIHRGFYQALQDVWGQITNHWDSLPLETKELPLFLTGHSLGGAMANNALFRLHQEKGIVTERCYTFGQPKIGNSNFANAFNLQYPDKLYRFHNDSDIVPLLPSVLFGYVDCGANLYINNKGQIHYDRNVSVFEQGVKHLIATAHDLLALKPGWIKDHSIDCYIQAIDLIRNK